MPLKAAKNVLKQTVKYIFANGRSMNAKVLGSAGTAQAAPGMATATTGGTLAAGTYVYTTTGVVNGVETAASVTGSQVTTGSTSTVTVTAATVTNATSYRFYGRTAGNQFFMKEQVSNVWTDTGSVTPNASILPPASTSTSSLLLPELQGGRLIHGVAAATSPKQTGAYHHRGI